MVQVLYCTAADEKIVVHSVSVDVIATT